MDRYNKLELTVGAFVLLGCVSLAYLGLTLGKLSLDGKTSYQLSARFSSVGDLKVGDPVKMAGVSVGEVTGVSLVDFVAQVDLAIEQGVPVPKDTIASIQSAGLLGDAYVSLSPGAALEDLSQGGRITRTEPALSITELISKYAFGSPLEGQDDQTSGDQAPSSDAASDTDKPSPFDDPFDDPLE